MNNEKKMGKDGKLKENFLYFWKILYLCHEKKLNHED